LIVFQESQNGEIITGIPTLPKDYEDLSEYKFQKFATTYFQGNVTHQFSKRALKQPLLPLQTQGDKLVSKRHEIHN
jgi:myosin-7